MYKQLLPGEEFPQIEIWVNSLIQSVLTLWKQMVLTLSEYIIYQFYKKRLEIYHTSTYIF